MVHQYPHDAIQYRLWIAFASRQITYHNYTAIWVANENASVAIIVVPEGYIGTTLTETGADIMAIQYAFLIPAFVGYLENGEDKSFLTPLGLTSDSDMALIDQFKELCLGRQSGRYRFVGGRVLLRRFNEKLDVDRDCWKNWRDLVIRTRQNNFDTSLASEFPWRVPLSRATFQGNKDVRDADVNTYIDGHFGDKDHEIPIFWYTYYGHELKVNHADIQKINWYASTPYKVWKGITQK